MGEALLHAAADAGVRITLLDTCYLAGGLRGGGLLPLASAQEAFGDGDVGRWAERVAALTDRPHARIGVAAHSVRAVPRDALPVLVEFARGRPLHVHVSEQRAENEQCLAAYRVTPVALLADAGVLGAHTTAVHATHLTDRDVASLGSARTFVAFCPSTERDLGDGIGPAGPLRAAGAVLTLGSDQHGVIDPLEEARALEMDERLRTGARGVFSAGQLVRALCSDGQRSLGWDDAGEIAPGRRADLTSFRLDTVRTAGTDPAQALFAATAADVHSVIIDGNQVVTDGQHRLGDVADLLASAMRDLTP
jgi:formiminoglutamate deiminase